MLQTISWKEFLVTVGLGLAVYYGWWMLRYRGGWKKANMGRRLEGGLGSDGGLNGGGDGDGDRDVDRPGDG